MSGSTRPIGTSLHRIYGVRMLAQPRVQVAAVGLLLAVTLVFRVIQFLVFSTQIQWGYDFSAYWQAGRLVLEGQPIYSAAQLAGQYGPQQQFLYLYPPFLAVAVAPLAAVFDDYRAAAWLWAGLGALIVAAVVLRIGRVEGLPGRRPVILLLGAACALPPVVGELVMGNVHILLLGLFAATWVSIREGTPRGELAAGVAIGLATLIKVFPGLLIIWFLLTGKRRAAVASVVCVALLAVSTIPVVGIDAWLDYPRVLANLGPATDTTDTLAPTVWLGELVGFGIARLVVTGAGLGLLVWSVTSQPTPVSFAVTVLVSVLVAPALYHHYLAISVLPFLLAVVHAGPRPWLLVAYLGMSGGDQPALGAAGWIVNRLMPTIGALVLLVGLLRVARPSSTVGPK